nr:putative RNA-directed DNA polymerase, eukaryota, reverse transcriptase zinc-binding domain protein [Tanacetum cinerariifolium]
MLKKRSANIKDHLQHLQIALDLLRTNKFFANAKKCAFGQRQIHVLGHVVSKDRVAVDLKKTDHLSLKHLLAQRVMTSEQQRLLMKLRPFDFTIIYKSRKENQGADAFSRRPQHADFLALAIPVNMGFLNLQDALPNDPYTKNIITSIRQDPTTHHEFSLSDCRNGMIGIRLWMLPKKLKFIRTWKGIRTQNSFMVKDAFFNYYNDKFQPIESHFDVNINPGFNAWGPNKALDLQKPAYLEEIRNAVWDCGSSKSSGPNGFSFLFLKTYGEFFKEDVEKSWIRSCLHSACTSILINGSPTAEFSLGRGLRGLKIGYLNQIFSHFFFADDVMILTEWGRRDLENITRSLHSFYLASGLKLNISKLNSYGVGVSEAELYSMTQLTGCQAELLWVKLMKAINGLETGFDGKDRYTHGIWANIVGSSIYLHSWNIMAASAIIISSDESVGSPPSRVILFGDIPTVIPSTFVITPESSAIAPVISSAAPVVETTIVASPTGLCGLVPYLDLDSDSPDEMASLEYITPLPATSPFLFIDSSEDSNLSEASDSSEAPPSQDPYVTTLLVRGAGTRRRAAILIRPGEAISLGQPYRTLPNGPQRVMTARNSPTDSLPVHSSSLDAPGQTHYGSSTKVVSPRLGYPPIRHSEACCRWCAAPLSTFYPPTTSESSSGDSFERPLHSSSHSARPSRKRCRSLANSVPSSAPVMGSLAPTRADILPPRKRFRDSYSHETSMEEDTEIDTTETEDGRELDIVDEDDVRDHIKVDPRDDREVVEASAVDTVVLGIDPRSVEDMSVDLDDAIRDLYHHMSEVRMDRIVGIETTQRQLKADQMIASGERAGMAESIRSLRLENLKVRALLCIKRDHVDILCLHMSRSQEEF